ncbi:potassium channel family protein [Pseudonocardia sp.]|uniref:potassium channel family protein n=1 Tax=Pseudonocardia sp. TaxID=60912 RepID=UPI003D129E36
MAHPFLLLWLRLVGEDRAQPGRRPRRRVEATSAAEATATIFLVMRRMRAPLIVLIVIFAVSVLGLTLIPGQDAAGRPWRMGFFDAFYVMSYTASTIGFGEIPYPFTANQRMWVTITIYLTVIGWAYAIGSLLSLLQDRAFRQAVALQRFRRQVARLREPFLLMVGYGRTGELLTRWFDALGRRVVVIDTQKHRIDELDLGTFRADVPALVADARDPGHLGVAGLNHPSCEAVLALADDEEANLAVVMSAALLRPDLPVIARTTSQPLGERMRAFGTPTVVNPFDCFGDHLRLALRSPAAHQLTTWLEAGPGAPLPSRGSPPRNGAWVVCGYGRLGGEVCADLRAEGLQVTAIDPRAQGTDEDVLVGDGSDPRVLARVGLGRAVGFVAGTDNDTTNLSLVAAARNANPRLYIAARQNRPASAPLFAAMEIDALLVPTEVIAREVYAQVSTPLLWRFLRELPARDDAWAAALVDRLTDLCGAHLQAMWKVRFTRREAPALVGWLASGQGRLGDLMRNPEDRDQPLHAVVLLVLRGDEAVLAPGPEFEPALDDEVLLVGRAAARRALDSTLLVDAVREYVTTGRRVPVSWIWRALRRSRPAQGPA